MRERDRHIIFLYENDPYFHRLVDVLIDVLENIPDPNLLHDAVNLAADKTMMERYYKKNQTAEGGERIMKLLYVRFGEIPTNGKSKNYLTGEYEKGVSVYEALERDEKMLILLPNLTGSACVTLSGVLDRPMFIIDGELCGTGSDGEPLLKNCKIVREIKNINHSRGW